MTKPHRATDARRGSVFSLAQHSRLIFRLFWVCSLFISGHLYAQSGQPDLLQASVDRTSLTLDETITLSLRYGKQSLFGKPNFDALDKDFEILNNNQSSKYQFINGRSESWALWSLTLAPRRTGKLTIPALSYDDEKSRPIVITVSDVPTLRNKTDQPVYLEVTLDKDQAFVQEQLLLTMKLFTSVDLNGLNSEALTIDNALVTQVSEHQYQRTVDGKAFGVVEVSYAIFPQQSGELVIPSLTWTVQVQAPKKFAYDPYTRDPFSGIRGQQSKRLRLRSPEKHIAVAPQPKNTQKHPWLPAQQLTLKQSWSQDPDSFVVGEPITRTIDVTAKGLMASQLPPLQLPALDGIKYYPDQPQTDDQTSADGVTGSRRESFAIVPSKAGSLTLPAITVNWWNTREDRLQQATMPAQTIQIKTNPNASSNFPAEGNNATLAGTVNDLTPSLREREIITADSPQMSIFWPIASAAGLLGSLIFALLWWRAQRQLQRSGVNTEQAAGQYSLGVNGDNAADFKALKQQLKRAASTNTLAANHVRELRLALLNWGKAQFNAHSLQAIAAQAPVASQASLSLLLQRFDASLYSREQTQPLSSSEFQELLKLLETLNKYKSQPKKEDLPPLYPPG